MNSNQNAAYVQAEIEIISFGAQTDVICVSPFEGDPDDFT